MDPTLLEVGIGAAIALLLLERVIALVRMILDHTADNADKKNGNGGTAGDHAELLDLARSTRQYVHDLHAWHDITDEEGVKIWYSRRSVERAVEKIADSQVIQTQILEKLVRISESQATLATEMQRTLTDMYTNMVSLSSEGVSCPFQESSRASKSTGSK